MSAIVLLHGSPFLFKFELQGSGLSSTATSQGASLAALSSLTLADDDEDGAVAAARALTTSTPSDGVPGSASLVSSPTRPWTSGQLELQTALLSQRSLSATLGGSAAGKLGGDEGRWTGPKTDATACATTHQKHYFILSCSGKPIYSYHGGEDEDQASLTALITALVSVVQDQVRAGGG